MKLTFSYAQLLLLLVRIRFACRRVSKRMLIAHQTIMVAGRRNSSEKHGDEEVHEGEAVRHIEMIFKFPNFERYYEVPLIL